MSEYWGINTVDTVVEHIAARMKYVKHESIEALEAIFRQWPEAHADRLAALKHLADVITKDFDGQSLAFRLRETELVLSRPLLLDDRAKILVYEACDPEYPTLATLVKGNDGKWRLQSLLFQCLSCFGTGVLNREPCNSCGATGWGLAGGNLT